MITTDYRKFIDSVNENATETVEIIDSVLNNINTKSKEINGKLKSYYTEKTVEGIDVKIPNIYYTILKYVGHGDDTTHDDKDIIFKINVTKKEKGSLKYDVLTNQIDGSKATLDNVKDNKGVIYAYQLVGKLANIAKLYSDDQKREELTDEHRKKLEEEKAKVLEKGKKYEYTSGTSGEKITIIVKDTNPEGNYIVANVNTPDSTFVAILKNVGNEVK